jgi:hypothetical protein
MIQVDDNFAAAFTMFFRPTTYARGGTTFSFYPATYFNSVILNMAAYYQMVRYDELTVEYVPPLISGTMTSNLAPMQVCVTSDTGLIANSPLDVYSGSYTCSPYTGWSKVVKPSQYVKRFGYPHTLPTASMTSLGNLQYTPTVCIYFPDYVGN